MAKDKFLRFQHHKQGYLYRFKFIEPEYENRIPSEDKLIKELLENIDDDLFYKDKLLMAWFKQRFNNGILYNITSRRFNSDD